MLLTPRHTRKTLISFLKSENTNRDLDFTVNRFWDLLQEISYETWKGNIGNIIYLQYKAACGGGEGFRLEMRKKFFIMRVVMYLNSLPTATAFLESGCLHLSGRIRTMPSVTPLTPFNFCLALTWSGSWTSSLMVFSNKIIHLLFCTKHMSK